MKYTICTLLFSTIFCMTCSAMNEDEYERAFDAAQQAELQREIAIAREFFFQANIENNTLLQRRILDLFSENVHEHIKLLATCAYEWSMSKTVNVATAWCFEALTHRDKALYDRLYNLINNEQYKIALATAVSERLMAEDPFAVPIDQSQPQSDTTTLATTHEEPEEHNLTVTASLTSLNFIDSDNSTTYQTPTSKSHELPWRYDLEGGFNEAWLIIEKPKSL